MRLHDFDWQFGVTTDTSDLAVWGVSEKGFPSGLQSIVFAQRYGVPG